MTIGARKPSQRFPGSTPPFRSVGFLLSSLGYAVSRRFHDALAPLELEPREFAVLRAVGVGSGSSQHALAEQLRISQSHMVSILDQLEGRGLLERKPEPSDRRIRTVHLTDRGHELLADAIDLAMHFEQLLTEPLTTSGRTQLLSFLDQIATALDLAPGIHPGLHKGD